MITFHLEVQCDESAEAAVLEGFERLKARAARDSGLPVFAKITKGGEGNPDEVRQLMFERLRRHPSEEAGVRVGQPHFIRTGHVPGSTHG